MKLQTMGIIIYLCCMAIATLRQDIFLLTLLMLSAMGTTFMQMKND